MDKAGLKARTKKFALRIIRLSQVLPNKPEAWVIKKQIVRSGTSVASNYRASLRARSDAEFISKLSTVIEEVDETAFWLEIIIESGMMDKKLINNLLDEANELTAIFVSSVKTKKRNYKS